MKRRKVFSGRLGCLLPHPVVELVRHTGHVAVQFEVALADPGSG
jgi:hypothetical protein